MPYRLRLTIRNPQAIPQDFVIYGGTVFEVLDPFNARQNLLAVNDTPGRIPGNGTAVIEIDTWCLNRDWRPPQDTPMQVTNLTTREAYRSQDELWTAMERFRALNRP